VTTASLDSPADNGSTAKPAPAKTIVRGAVKVVLQNGTHITAVKAAPRAPAKKPSTAVHRGKPTPAQGQLPPGWGFPRQAAIAIPAAAAAAAEGKTEPLLPPKSTLNPALLLRQPVMMRPLSIAAVGCHIAHSAIPRAFDPSSPECRPAGQGGILVANAGPATYARKLALLQDFEAGVDGDGLPRLDVTTMAELGSQQWHELRVFAATPTDWGVGGAKPLCWGDMRLVAAFGVAAV
jgi:hypothetical protein